jgi:hypothetical protein
MRAVVMEGGEVERAYQHAITTLHQQHGLIYSTTSRSQWPRPLAALQWQLPLVLSLSPLRPVASPRQLPD